MPTQISILVKPNASKDEIRVIDGEVWISVTAVPDKGKANKAIIRLLSKQLDISNNSITIISGSTSRTKVVEINGLSEEEIIEILSKP